MAYYSDDFIDEVLSQNDIVDIVSGYVSLTKSGRNFMGLCPFHKEKSPSFCVSMDKQIFKCFGCSKSGNVIKFIREIEHMEFIDALEFLADKAHIDKSKYIVQNNIDKESAIKKSNLRDTILRINKDTALYYHNNLVQNIKEKNTLLIDYLNKRKLDIKAVTKFGIGYANGNVSLYDHLKKLGYSESDILAAGNVVKNENGKIYDRFFSRLMFPIFDISGRVIAFGGRVLNDSKPKYLNSAENVVYYKSKHLYMMNFAVKEKIEKILIVEGYMDALSLQKNGISFAVASLGTALTENQAKLIKKYTDNVIIGYDQDSAGQEATIRGMEILSKEGINVKVLKLDKEGIKDPDEYITKLGKERFLKCLEKSIPLVEYKISRFENELNIDDVTSKVKFLNKVASVLGRINNLVERELYIDRISEKYQISKGAIENEVSKLTVKKNSETPNISVRELTEKEQSMLSTRKKMEQYIIALMLSKDKKILNAIFENIDETMIKTEGINKLFRYIKELSLNYDLIKIDILSKIDDDDMAKELTDIMYIDDIETNKYKLLDDVLKYLKKENLTLRRKEIFDEISKNISNDEKEILQVELSEITKELAKLK